MAENALPEKVRALIEQLTSELKKTQGQLRALRAARSEPIAIIGMGCRFPGGANDPDSYFELLASGVDAVREIPTTRWSAELLPRDNPAVRWAGLLERVDGFDSDFFAISPREATSLDPQQRLLLEVIWEALENAGIRPETLDGSRTGVFIGASTSDYRARVSAKSAESLEAYDITGNLLSIAAGRISYVLGLQGPCLTIDTACSSSLVAIHTACGSLRNGECALALVGGVNVILDPRTMLMLSRTQALSPDGRCKTFDASANGFVRAEGCGVVVLKRLSDARRDGDRIWATIRGSAVNQDGRSSGLTAPNVRAQEEMLRQALDSAGVAPSEIGLVETHGTGTSLGDPIEIEALTAVLGAPRGDGSTCVLGAVKSNLGHLEAAAGIAGLIKATLCLDRQAIPANLHFRTLNPRISLEGTPFVIPTALRAFPKGGRSRFAGVSSFGLSGTNAHVILEEAPPVETGASEPRARPLALLLVTGRSAAALSAQAAQYRHYLDVHAQLPFADVCRSSALQRSHFAERIALVAATGEEAAARLGDLLQGESAEGIVRGHADPGAERKVAFLFTGQGAQYVQMGRELYEREPVFRQAILTCAAILDPLLGQPLTSVLYPAEGTATPIDDTAYTQPALFAIEWALSELWRSWGVEPDVVIGHSVGEYVAACVAGVFTLEEGLRLIAERGRLMQLLPRDGAMAAVRADLATVMAAIVGHEHQVSVAAVNGPDNVVISGERGVVERLCQRFEAAGRKSTALAVSHAFHSPLMEPALDAFARAAARVTFRRPRIPLISNLSGLVARDEVTTPEYWRRHVREPVQFAAGVGTLADLGVRMLLEVGPQPTLLGLAMQILGESGRRWAASLRKGRPAYATLLAALGGLWADGATVDWDRFVGGPARRIALPTYPWQREHYFVEAAVPAAAQPPAVGHAGRRYTLAGSPLAVPGDDLVQILRLSTARQDYLADHVVYGRAIVPGAFFMAVLLAVAVERFGASSVTLRNVHFVQPLALADEVDLYLALKLRQPGHFSFSLLTLPSGQTEAAGRWREHVLGELLLSAAPSARAPSLAELRDRCPQPRPLAALWTRLAESEILWGPRWRYMETLQAGGEQALSQLAMPTEGSVPEAPIHPGLLDNALLTAFTVLLQTDALPKERPYLPWTLGELRFYATPSATTYCLGRLQSGTSADDVMASDLVLFDDTGRVLLEADAFCAKQARRDALLRYETAAVTGWLYGRLFRRAAPAVARDAAEPGYHVLVGGESELRARLAAALAAHGESVIFVEPGERFEVLGSERIRVNVERPEDSHALIGVLAARGGCRGLVHLLSLESAPVDALTDERLQRDLARGTVSALQLVQAVVAQGFQPGRLVLVTAGAQSVAEQPAALSPAAAPLWGFGQTLALEHPELACKLIDLGAADRIDECELLAAELLAGAAETQVAIRGSHRYVGRLVRGATSAAAPLPPPTIRADGAYLISGGHGGLGLLLAELLVDEGATHLFLLGREGARPSAAATIERLRRAGATVVSLAVDVADRQALAALIERFGTEWPPLRGIFHLAAILDDAMVSDQSAARFERVMAAKVQGAWNLHTLTREQPLDLFVCYSSAAALLGSVGQANYAAANAFLDALAQLRGQEGLCAMTIDWGAVDEVGMAAGSAELRSHLLAQGIDLLSPSEATQALRYLLGHPRPQVGVIKLDVRRWFASAPRLAQVPYFSELEAGEGTTKRDGAPSDRWKAALLGAPADSQQSIVESFVKEQLAHVLQLPRGRIDTGIALPRLGIDSLMAVELRDRIDAAMQVMVPIPLLLKDTTASALAGYILDRMPGRALTATAADEIEEGAV